MTATLRRHRCPGCNAIFYRMSEGLDPAALCGDCAPQDALNGPPTDAPEKTQRRPRKSAPKPAHSGGLG